MEYVPHGPLSSLIVKRKGLPLDLVRLYAAQLVLFLEYLHTKMKVCHRDLKPANMMVASNLYLKIVSLIYY